MRTETVCEYSLPDRLTRMFTQPYVFVPFSELRALLPPEKQDGAKGQVPKMCFNLRACFGGKRVLGVLGTGGRVWIPHDAPDQFSLLNFREMPTQITDLRDGQREACERIWPHARKATVITFIRHGQTERIIQPLLAEPLYEHFMQMVSLLATQTRGVQWNDILPPYIDEIRGRKYLESKMCIINSFLEGQSLPYRLRTAYGEGRYKFGPPKRYRSSAFSDS